MSSTRLRQSLECYLSRAIALPEGIGFEQLSISKYGQDTPNDYETTTLAVLLDVVATTVGEEAFIEV